MLSIMVQGCSTPYYGYTKENWNDFTEEEKALIKNEYQAITDIRNSQSHANKINKRTQSVIDYGVSNEQ